MTLQGFSDWASLVWAISMTVGWVGAIGAITAVHKVNAAHSKWLTMLTGRVDRLEAYPSGKMFSGRAGDDRSFVMAVGTGPISSLMGKSVPMPPHIMAVSGHMPTVPPKEGSGMRSEAEVRAMIAEIEAIRSARHAGDGGVADAVILALENVLNGPMETSACACLGPPGLCRCQIMRLGLTKRAVEDG